MTTRQPHSGSGLTGSVGLGDDGSASVALGEHGRGLNGVHLLAVEGVLAVDR